MIKKLTKSINSQNMECVEISCDRCGKIIDTWYIGYLEIDMEWVKDFHEKYYKCIIPGTKESLCEECFNRYKQPI